MLSIGSAVKGIETCRHSYLHACMHTCINLRKQRWYSAREGIADNARVLGRVGCPPSADTASCQQHIRPYLELAGDLANDTVHGYAFLTPNLCHDMHRNLCWGGWNPVKQGDEWLAANLPPILASAVYQRGEALVVMTWDEGSDDDTNHPLGMILLSPKTKGHGYTNTALYTHSSLVKTLEAIFGLSPLVGHAADAATQDLSDFFA